MQINDDVWVTVRYRLFDVQGEPLEAGERELTFLQGGYGAVGAGGDYLAKRGSATTTPISCGWRPVPIFRTSSRWA